MKLFGDISIMLKINVDVEAVTGRLLSWDIYLRSESFMSTTSTIRSLQTEVDEVAQSKHHIIYDRECLT